MFLAAAISGCGGAPLLSGLPQPNKAVAAGIAVAAASAATALDPNGGARIKEAGKVQAPEKADEHRETIPLDVLDRMDAQQDDDDDDPQ